MILFIGIASVILTIIVVIVYFVFFSKTDEERCNDAGNTWDATLKKCKTQKDLCEEDGNIWTEENVCKTRKQLCEADQDIWDNDQCWTPSDHCEINQKLVYTNNGDCITHEQDCTNKGNKWIPSGVNKGCHTPIDYCKFDNKRWNSETKKCDNVIVIKLKGKQGDEKVKISTKTNAVKKEILGETVVPKVGITKTFYLASKVSEFIIDFTNDDGPKDVIVTELKLNGNDIMSSVKDRSVGEMPAIRKGNLSWGGEYFYSL